MNPGDPIYVLRHLHLFDYMDRTSRSVLAISFKDVHNRGTPDYRCVVNITKESTPGAVAAALRNLANEVERINR